MARSRRRATDDEVRRAIAGATSIAEALRRLGLVGAGGNYRTLYRRIAALEIDTTHIVGQAWRRGKPNTAVRRRSLEEVLTVGTYANTNKLKSDSSGRDSSQLHVNDVKDVRGTASRSRSNSITSMAVQTTTGSRISASCARTAMRRPRRIGDAISAMLGRAPVAQCRGKRPKPVKVWVRVPPGALCGVARHRRQMSRVIVDIRFRCAVGSRMRGRWRAGGVAGRLR